MTPVEETPNHFIDNNITPIYTIPSNNLITPTKSPVSPYPFITTTTPIIDTDFIITTLASTSTLSTIETGRSTDRGEDFSTANPSSLLTNIPFLSTSSASGTTSFAITTSSSITSITTSTTDSSIANTGTIVPSEPREIDSEDSDSVVVEAAGKEDLSSIIFFPNDTEITPSISPTKDKNSSIEMDNFPNRIYDTNNTNLKFFKELFEIEIPLRTIAYLHVTNTSVKIAFETNPSINIHAPNALVELISKAQGTIDPELPAQHLENGSREWN